jgi:exoribonuclease R
LIKAAINKQKSPYDKDDLIKLALHCTDQENAAARVERQVIKSASALFLFSRIGERFDAIVTGASASGTWARTLQFPVEVPNILKVIP